MTDTQELRKSVRKDQDGNVLGHRWWDADGNCVKWSSTTQAFNSNIKQVTEEWCDD